MVTPQLLHFVVRNLTYTDIGTGYLVTCYTNNPCHLWLRWTAIIPQKHINTRVVRGAPVGTYIDQCFVVFTDVEQNEPGDTFTHTFTLEPWFYCETRWFYFWGKVGGVLSPSASCIFSKHRFDPSVYCSATPLASGAYTNAACTVFSIPFVPCSSFTATAFVSNLRRRDGFLQADEWQIFLFKADLDGKPTEFLCWANVVFPYPLPYPSFEEFVLPLPPTQLVAGQPYVHAFRCQYQHKYENRRWLEFQAGAGDTCPFPPHIPPPYYSASPALNPDGSCKLPDSSPLWTYRLGGGIAYYQIRGVPTP